MFNLSEEACRNNQLLTSYIDGVYMRSTWYVDNDMRKKKIVF